jgi:predicted CXXCH cytochrome family protein
MDALLRELREGPDGIPEYHDTELTGDELTIGSAADQRIQLLGRAVAPEHAVIRKSGTQLEIQSRRGQRVRVNDEQVSSAKLAVGDVVEVGGHRLTIAEPPGGFDTAIELRPNDNIDASEFEGAFRTDLFQTWMGKRPMAWITVALVLLMGLALPLVVITLHHAHKEVSALVPSDRFWSSGPLSPAHQQAAGERCDTCHQQLFVRVQDSACQACHRTIHDHITPEHLAMTQLGPGQRCATCHREHNEPATFLVNSGDGLCIDCHKNPEHDFGKLKLEPVGGFSASRHPAFKAHLLKPKAIEAGSGAAFEWHEEIAALDRAREQSNLKFSHLQHLDPDRVLRTGDSQPLNCADCHRLESDGEHFQPITMQGRCASCHELTFDPAAPERQLPHGKPREVVLTLQDYYTRKFSDPNAGRQTRERRRLPGDRETEQTCTGSPFDCAMRSAGAEIENQFSRRGCVGCHIVVDTKADDVFDRFQVYPIRFARDYFPTGRFDHRSHQIQGKLTGDAACLSCHKAKDSKDSSDLMLPTMAKCEQCHGDRPAVERIKVQCVSCHAYHPDAHPQGTLLTNNEKTGS